MDLLKFEDKDLARKLVRRIESLAGHLDQKRLDLMEVCGTHTMAIARYGIRQLLPEKVRLISGPGCPVCVTSQEDIDRLIAIARLPGVILGTFGDMIRVPGTGGSLSQARAEGADIRVVYSCLDALEIAAANSGQEVVFAGVGFETTSPTVAAVVREAKEKKQNNFSVYPAFKLVPPALRTILASDRLHLDGFLLPGHVSAIIGCRAYGFIAEDYGKPGVVAGFEALDILGAVAMLLEMIVQGRPGIVNEYRRGVSQAGNEEAMRILREVFHPAGAKWRAIGEIPESGLEFNEEFKDFDARQRFEVPVIPGEEPQGCLCGQVMMGAVQPDECPLFGQGCRPESPVGPCMVSSEGACAAWFRYGVGRIRR